MSHQKPWRRVLAAISAVGILAFTFLIASHPRDFERLFLKTAGSVIEGVNDKLAIWIAGFVAACLLSWAGLGLACLLQRRRS